MDPQVALHFRDQLRDARGVALKDAEAFEQVVFVLERIGVYLTGEILNLGGYAEPLAHEAGKSPLAEAIPSELPEWHARFSTLYDLVRRARNDALHEGAFARHLTNHAVELSVVLEDALMTGEFCARDYMVRDVVRAHTWQPISSIRRSMLVNAFSFLPVDTGSDGVVEWRLLSDYATAAYLRGTDRPAERMKRLARKLAEAVKEGTITLDDAPQCRPEDSVAAVLGLSKGRPVLVVGANRELMGIVTPFDML